VRERPLLTIVALVVASLLCVATVELRIARTDDPFYRFLVWNLFLAWVPFALALLAFLRARRGVDAATAVLLVLWLLFFPNAPYLLTDFVHLGSSPTAPVWYDALMLSAFAWTALLLGFASLYLVQLIARRTLGRAASWAVVVCALALGSVGVYLGRFVRVNSWDALVRPGRLLDVVRDRLESPLDNPQMVAALVALTVFLLVGYGVLYGFASMRLELERDE